jgi:hypothetical protein
MNEANFVKRVNHLVTGDMYLAERELPLTALRDPTSGNTVLGFVSVAGGDPATIEGQPAVNGVQLDDDDQALLQFQIPQDYAQGKDVAALRLMITPTGSNDTTDIGITSAQTIWRDGAAADATAATAVAESAQAASTNSREVILDISGRSYQPGDVVQLTIDVNAAGTDELVVNGMSLIYGSNMAAYNDDDRFRSLGSAEV